MANDKDIRNALEVASAKAHEAVNAVEDATNLAALDSMDHPLYEDLRNAELAAGNLCMDIIILKRKLKEVG